MPPLARHSIAEPASLSGVGLHTGSDTTLTFRPADSGRGIVFRRVDLPHRPEIPALVTTVCAAERRTVLGVDGATIDTVEHVLAAVSGLEIDDLCIDVDGPEVPILDGSAEPFFSALRNARRVVVGGEVHALVVRQPVVAQEGDAVYRAYPGPRTVTVTVEWTHPVIGKQEGSYGISPEAFGEELARARTFGFVHEVEVLRDRGLINGGHLGCAVVLSDSGVVNGKLRWADEFVRHKTVDLLGDLALAGGRLSGTIEAIRPSHRGNIAFARALQQHCSSGK
jgi:UDP-3-O-acyl N-acetylglucosamine deacetylase